MSVTHTDTQATDPFHLPKVFEHVLMTEIGRQMCVGRKNEIMIFFFFLNYTKQQAQNK